MDGVAASREAQLSIAAAAMFPGFRFSPTDEELISYYLRNKVDGSEEAVEVVREVEIWKYEPWELPAKSVIPSENEWFFFSPRGRKYPNGSQSRRATEMGYWKATGKERNVKSGLSFIGSKRTLVFHMGRAPKGERTEWLMHEYCLLDKSQDFMVVCRLKKNNDFRLHVCTNRASTSHTPLSTIRNRNPSEVNSDRVNMGDGFGSKQSNGSDDYYSSEQNGSASENNQKPALEVTQPEPSHKVDDDDDVDDFFAEILKDDIINLDKSSITTDVNTGPWVDNETSVSDSFDDKPSGIVVAKDRHELRAAEPLLAPSVPFQGTANRRIRLSKSAPSRQNRDAYSKPSLDRHVVLVVLAVLLTLVALFVHLFGGPFTAHCVKAA